MYRRLFSVILDQQQSSEIIKKTQEVSSTFFPCNLESFKFLLQSTPCFPLYGEQIKIIQDPNKFYQTILEKASQAKNRVVLASLYLGTGALETSLVSSLNYNLLKNDNLSVKILIDYNRGTRGEVNSKLMFNNLLKNFEEKRFTLSMYHTPALRGIFKKLTPPRYNELVGLQHMKVYLFDNSVIISGANLSNDYFTNRQDRYVLIEDKSLADFYEALISKVQEFSLKVNNNDLELSLNKNWKWLPYEGNKENFVSEAKNRISTFFNNVYEKQKIELENKKDADTWIFPLIEMGQLGIHHDSVITKKIISSSVKESTLILATGYFNLTQDYMNIIKNSCAAYCKILMAHPNANGFKGAKGPAGGIPDAYSLIAKKFYDDLVDAQQASRVHISEYEKPNWTYHAKGLWYYLPEGTLPCLTLIGSSNFGERSVNRDLETQVCIITRNEKLQMDLQSEIDNLYQHSKLAEIEISKRVIPKWVRMTVKLFRNFF